VLKEFIICILNCLKNSGKKWVKNKIIQGQNANDFVVEDVLGQIQSTIKWLEYHEIYYIKELEKKTGILRKAQLDLKKVYGYVRSRKPKIDNMQFKLSKSQWEEMGKKAGWIKNVASEEIYPKECPACHGEKLVHNRIKDLGTSEYRDAIENCSMCNGKGYITKEDNIRYLHNMGVASCPHCNDIKDKKA